MYAKRIQISNFGPIERLTIDCEFDGDKPMPIVLVGENGSGKSILLSHIVNGLLLAQQSAYPETPEFLPVEFTKCGVLPLFALERILRSRGWISKAIYLLLNCN